LADAAPQQAKVAGLTRGLYNRIPRGWTEKSIAARNPWLYGHIFCLSRNLKPRGIASTYISTRLPA